MSFSVGIVGFPNVGKSTLFKILTKREVKISNRPFTTIEPNVGQVTIPDERLEKIAGLIKPDKITPTTIEFVDIAGLIKGAHQGEGLGNQFLNHIKGCDLILMVIRVFEDLAVENVLGEINPEKEIEVLKLELLMKDLETIEKLVTKLESKKDLKKLNILKKIKEELTKGRWINEIELEKEEKEKIKEYQLLTQKPIFFLFNINGKGEFKETKINNAIKINLKEEEELLEFSEEEKKELEIKSKIDELIKGCYLSLDLITFYTVAGGKETKAWTVKKGTMAPEAGGIVHSDFKNKFIKAEVLNWMELIKAKSWNRAKELGFVKLVGKEYQIRDGDVIEFKI